MSLATLTSYGSKPKKISGGVWEEGFLMVP